jgi:hypothetical protein
VDVPAPAEQALLAALTVKADARTRSVDALLAGLSIPVHAPSPQLDAARGTATAVDGPIEPKPAKKSSAARTRRRTSAAPIETVQAVAVPEPADDTSDVDDTSADYRLLDSDAPATRAPMSPFMRVIAGAIVLAFFAILIWVFTEMIQ